MCENAENLSLRSDSDDDDTESDDNNFGSAKAPLVEPDPSTIHFELKNICN